MSASSFVCIFWLHDDHLLDSFCRLLFAHFRLLSTLLDWFNLNPTARLDLGSIVAIMWQLMCLENRPHVAIYVALSQLHFPSYLVVALCIPQSVRLPIPTLECSLCWKRAPYPTHCKQFGSKRSLISMRARFVQCWGTAAYFVGPATTSSVSYWYHPPSYERSLASMWADYADNFSSSRRIWSDNAYTFSRKLAAIRIVMESNCEVELVRVCAPAVLELLRWRSCNHFQSS